MVDYVSAATPSIRVFDGIVSRDMTRQLVTFVACAVALIFAVMLAPRHAVVFFERMGLGTAQYPTRTRIERIFVNRTLVHSAGDAGAEPEDCNAPQGRPLTFLVECSGQLPASGTVELVAAGGKQQRSGISLAVVPASKHLDGSAMWPRACPIYRNRRQARFRRE